MCSNEKSGGPLLQVQCVELPIPEPAKGQPMKNLTIAQTACVQGGAAFVDSQMCLADSPYDFDQFSLGMNDQVLLAAQRPYDPPIEGKFPSKWDIGLALLGLGVSIYTMGK